MIDDFDRGERRMADRGAGRGPLFALAAVLIATFGLQFLFADDSLLEWAAVSFAALAEGRWYTPLTSVFVHAGVLHIGMNLMALIALGAPVSTRFPGTARGVAAFFAFFLVCGVLASLGFVALHPYGQAGAVGASGAICGLWGAATRLVDDRRRLSPIWSHTVWLNVQSLVKQNLLMIVVLFGFSLLSQGQTVTIAWQAHLAGFVAGLLLIGPFLRLGGWRAAPDFADLAA
ncbi:rhomboid family intramembrane serine protease [Caulobacter sp. KR2-114]|uniref:rhomboid family intramembrane serine protease n=1 Tax=Caulobacter sp. KR2-114 TaxID=3400912 RepID=UPI003C00BB5E